MTLRSSDGVLRFTPQQTRNADSGEVLCDPDMGGDTELFLRVQEAS